MRGNGEKVSLEMAVPAQACPGVHAEPFLWETLQVLLQIIMVSESLSFNCRHLVLQAISVTYSFIMEMKVLLVL